MFSRLANKLTLPGLLDSFLKSQATIIWDRVSYCLILNQLLLSILLQIAHG